MTITLDQGTIRLIGACGVEEAETLVTFLESHPELAIDLSGATALHTALWQTLMVFRPPVTGVPAPSMAMGRAFEALRAFHPRSGT